MMQEPQVLDCKGSARPGQAVSVDCTGQVGARFLAQVARATSRGSSPGQQVGHR